jgi:hypothetical protein
MYGKSWRRYSPPARGVAGGWPAANRCASPKGPPGAGRRASLGVGSTPDAELPVGVVPLRSPREAAVSGARVAGYGLPSPPGAPARTRLWAARRRHRGESGQVVAGRDAELSEELRRRKSTVRGLTKSRSATCRLVRPSPTKRAIWSFCRVSSSIVLGSRRLPPWTSQQQRAKEPGGTSSRCRLEGEAAARPRFAEAPAMDDQHSRRAATSALLPRWRKRAWADRRSTRSELVRCRSRSQPAPGSCICPRRWARAQRWFRRWLSEKGRGE